MVCGPQVNLGPVVNSPANDYRPVLSKNGLSLYFDSNRPGSIGSCNAFTCEGSDIYVTHRANRHLPWDTPRKVEALSSSADDLSLTFSADGHWAFFASDRAGGCGGLDVYAAHREDTDNDFDWEQPFNLGCTLNSPGNDAGPMLFTDENGTSTLYIDTLNRPGGAGDWDIFSSLVTYDQHNGISNISTPTPVTELNTPQRDVRPFLHKSGLAIFITSLRPGGLPGRQRFIWLATRASTSDRWGTPVNLDVDGRTATFSHAGNTVYFDSTRLGGFGNRDLYSMTCNLGDEDNED